MTEVCVPLILFSVAEGNNWDLHWEFFLDISNNLYLVQSLKYSLQIL